MSKLHIASGISLDLLRLVDSRMLINANSGGGKSWLLRLIAEQASGHAQTIILDPEGEFATLREKFDFLLVGQSGEIPAEPRAAALLARRLLELQASAVIDLYDLRLPERRRFVRLFLESLMHLPKTAWHPLLVMLDEAHLFCPERSAGEAESTAAVIDLMSQGRKRSYCGILATQRLSKLHKDAEAETNNVFVGRTWLDVDQKRAGALLGFDAAKRIELRDLEHEFFAFGPALSEGGVVRLKPNQVQTTHPKAGHRHKLTPPKPSEAVKRIVADLADLPQQAEAEVRDLADAKKKIAELERRAKARPAAVEQVVVEKKVEVPVLKNGQLDKTHRIIDRLEKIASGAIDAAKELAGVLGAKLTEKPAAPVAPRAVPVQRPAPRPAPVRTPRPANDSPGGPLPVGERLILSALIQYPAGLTRQQLTVIAGYKRSTRDTYLQRLGEKGYVSSDGAKVYATDEGRAALPDAEPLPTGEALQQHWLARLPQGERLILECLIHAYPNSVSRDELTAQTGYQRSTRDTYLQRMGAKELVELVGRGEVRASRTLFD